MSFITTRDRRWLWASSGLLLFFNGALVLWLGLHPAPYAIVAAVDNLAQTVGAFLGIVLCGVGLLRMIPRNWRTRTLWVPLLFGLAIAGQCIGQAIYTIDEQLLQQTFPFPSWADAGYLSAYPVLLLGIVLLPRSGFRAHARSRLLLDGLMIMTAMVTFSWYFILGPTMLQGTGALFAKVVGAAYPFADLVLIFCLLLLVFRPSQRAFRPVLWLLILALLLIVVADSLLDYQSLHDAYMTGGLQDVLWPLGYMLIGLAAQVFCVTVVRGQQAVLPPPASLQDPLHRRALWWRSLLPYAFVPPILLLTSITEPSGKGPLETGVYIGSAVLIGLVLLRQVLALRETQLSATQTQALNTQLLQVNGRLEALSTTDPLTNLPNHRALLDSLEKEMGSARRYGQALSILFFDGDHFKRVNDTYGHSVGDAVLQELGRRGRDNVRAGDTIGRYGGEEFMVLLPQTDPAQACEVAERLRKAIADHPLATGLVDGGIPLTISIGVSTFPVDGQTASEVVDKADQAMYWAKRLGRNQIRTALEAERASQDTALAATILNLERRETPSLDGLTLQQSVRANQLGTIQSLMELLDARDQGISAHSYEVSDLAGAIARERGLDQETALAVSTAALLHDIGKIALPDQLLQKAGTLSSQEWELIKHHPAFGAQILEVSPYLHDLMPGVHHHHENWDGTGYPDALAGEAIPLAARIIRVAEACSAMMSSRVYQAARSSSSTCYEVQRCAGTQFDPEIVQAAITILGRREKEAIAGREERPVF